MLVIGVADDHTTVGIEVDYPSTKASSDGWRLAFDKLVSSNLGTAAMNFIELRLEPWHGKMIAIVRCARREEPTLIDDDELFVRRTASTVKLSMREAPAWWRERRVSLTSSAAPQLEGDALAAVLHRGSHLQIIASAGSGKTEVVAQRFAELMADGADPAGIIAFTFTERAAEELKARISARVEERLGPGALDKLGAAFVGTIHSYCFRLLQQHVPRYETFDVLDERRLTAFLCREEPALRLKDLTGKLFTSIKAFLGNLEVVENELIPLAELDEPFKAMAEKFYELLEQFRLLTYGQLISRAVAELEKPDVAGKVHGALQHLIVDEYQDVNPAQERLIRLLTGPQVELCVVGDDDQAIYQWRGSDVRNIVEFTDRYPGVRTFTITVNRRSRPRIVAAAASFARSIPGRLDKQMSAFRPSAGPGGVEVVSWAADTEADECDRIAETIKRLHDAGLPYRRIAVLVRTRAAYPALLDAFDAHGVPVQPAGRTGLFAQPEAQLFGKTYAWLVDHSWSSEPCAWGEIPADDEVFDGLPRPVLPGRRAGKAGAGAAAGPEGQRPQRGPAGQPGRRLLRTARRPRRRRLGRRRPDDELAAGHARAVLVDPGRLRGGPPAQQAPPASSRRPDRRPGPRQLVLHEPGDLHRQLRQGRLRGLRRRARRADRRGRPDHHPQGQGSGVGRGVRAVADHQPLPVIDDRAAAGLAGPAAPVQPGALRGLRRRRTAAVLRRDDQGAGLAVAVPARAHHHATGSPPRRTTRKSPATPPNRRSHCPLWNSSGTRTPTSRSR